MQMNAVSGIMIRPYQPQDASALAGVFCASIMAIDGLVYSDAQKQAWIDDGDSRSSLVKWQSRFARTKPLVAIIDNVPIGFIEYLDNENQNGQIAENEAYIDCLYIYPDYKGLGIAQHLYNQAIKDSDAKTIWVHASKIAQPFFAKQGFQVVVDEQVERDGVMLQRFLMVKHVDF